MSLSSKYHAARWYAMKIAPQNSADIVHDCIIKYGQEFFDKDPALINHIIKLTYYNKVKKKTRYMWRGEYHDRIFLPNMDLYGGLTPWHVVVAQDLEEKLRKSLSPKENTVLDLLLQGYNHTEIGDIYNTYRQDLNNVVKRIRKKYSGVAQADRALLRKGAVV